jgi:hypothetical protein
MIQRLYFAFGMWCLKRLTCPKCKKPVFKMPNYGIKLFLCEDCTQENLFKQFLEIGIIKQKDMN